MPLTEFDTAAGYEYCVVCHKGIGAGEHYADLPTSDPVIFEVACLKCYVDLGLGSNA